jgi:hypothetical protein
MKVKTSKPKTTQNSRREHTKLDGVVIGVLSSLNTEGHPLVIFPGNPSESPVVARTVAACKNSDVGREVALLFEDGDPAKPLLVGLIQEPLNLISSEAIPRSGAQDLNLDTKVEENPYIELDGERIELKAKQEITLKCGRASITLTKAGKVLIRGAYLLNRSSGVNRIKGGSVQIN